ncbi:MAG: hypothetical protein KBI10_09550 [Syntrophorhabdales bacterium]|nr:hypothetical protein [Syntrophorhabdales bacterium]
MWGWITKILKDKDDGPSNPEGEVQWKREGDAMEPIMEEHRECAIISCMGNRPLALISPVNSLMHYKAYNPQVLSISIFFSSKTKNYAMDCKGWLKEMFPGIAVNLLPFENNNLSTTIESIASHATTLYFNTNPGMNWQITTLALYLPVTTTAMYADFKDLYLWPLNKDIKEAKRLELKDIGLETYNRFSDKNFNEKEGINEGLSENLKEFLQKEGFNRHFIVDGRLPEIKDIKDFIRDRLVWVRERHGNIYLLFDFQGEKGANQQNQTLSMYRAITDIFDPLNFSITIIINNTTSRFKERAKVDGISYLYEKDSSKWQEQLLKWLKGKVEIVPKGVIPQMIDRKEAIRQRPSGDKTESSSLKSGLFVCLGDNIEPTLKAIHSHNLKDVYLFYDDRARRIQYLAQNVKDVLVDYNIIFVPTDNKGSGIMNYIENKAKDIDRIDINITPGTKSQGMMMVQAAKKIGRTDYLYSIDKDSIRSLDNASVSFSVKSPSIEELLNIGIAPGREKVKLPDFPAISIMKGFAEGKIKIHPNILGLKLKDGVRLFEILSKDDEGYRELKCNLDGNTYLLNPEFFKETKSGIWWEVTVAHVLQANLTGKVHWSATWDWPSDREKKTKEKDKEKEPFISELDVVFEYKNHICVVSCKTGRERTLDPVEHYALTSEARKRFGRFALPFMAAPFDEHKGKRYDGYIEADIMYLTPSLLIDEERLKKRIDDFIESKKTTSKRV